MLIQLNPVSRNQVCSSIGTQDFLPNDLSVIPVGSRDPYLMLGTTPVFLQVKLSYSVFVCTLVVVSVSLCMTDYLQMGHVHSHITSFNLSVFIARRTASAVYAVVVCLSVRPYVYLSVTRRYCTKAAKRRITQTTPCDIPRTLVFMPKSRRKFQRSHSLRGRQIQMG